MEALTINNLCGYLPYGLKFIFENKENYSFFAKTGTILTLTSNNICLIEDSNFGLKPICFSLDNLAKPITINGETFVPMEKLSEMSGYRWDNATSPERTLQVKLFINNITSGTVPYKYINKLFEWKFAINLPEGSWIDVNSLEENPYK